MDYTVRSGKPYTEKPLRQPALFIGGTTDMVTMMLGGTDKIEKSLAQSAPNCAVKWLECGHWIQNERHTEVNALLLGFLKDNFPRANL